MNTLNLVVVYHPRCKASTDFIIKVSKLSMAEIEYINIESDRFETELDLDVVPLMIINNDPSQIFRGERAFLKIDELIKKDSVEPSNKKETKSGGVQYGRKVNFVEQSDEKKQRIDLGKK